MELNSFLFRLGIDPDNFENKLCEPIMEDNKFYYYVTQKKTKEICPTCNSTSLVVKGYYQTQVNMNETDIITDTLIIKRIRYKCKNCNHTFSPEIKGISKYATISESTKNKITNDMFKQLTFKQIADRYGVSITFVINHFDSTFKYIPRAKLPEILCIDEIHFSRDLDQKYICVLYDYQTRRIIDIIQNRQLAYLREYFSNIPKSERDNVKYFISDMYDGYKSIHSSYFPHAIHIVDLFHIITQLSNAVSTIRIRTMNKVAEPKSKEYNFMKSHWKLFLCRYSKVPNKFYTYKKTNVAYHFDEMLSICLRLNNEFHIAYNILQDLYQYNRKQTFESALSFILYISERLLACPSKELNDVGRTYKKWRIEISNGFTSNKYGINLSNSVAEGLNNQLKTILKSAYGYKNFNRFRKRALLILGTFPHK